MCIVLALNVLCTIKEHTSKGKLKINNLINIINAI